MVIFGKLRIVQVPFVFGCNVDEGYRRYWVFGVGLVIRITSGWNCNKWNPRVIKKNVNRSKI